MQGPVDGGRRLGLLAWLGWLVLGPALAGLVVLGTLWVTIDVPPPEEVRVPQASVLLWSDGTPLARTGVEDRTSVPLEQVSLAARQAVLAAEDRRFYDSGGVSPRAVLRALVANVRSGQVEQGGSTITQQYARNAFLSQEQTLDRKVREAVIALKLDSTRSKDQLLERYLNTVYFGRGAYGIEVAARRYFGVPAAELTASQGAVLASLLRSPSGYDPARHPERARERWRYVLDGMAAEGWLPGGVAAQEYPEVRPRTTGDRLGGPEGYLVEQVREELADLGWGEDAVDVRGLRVLTTFDRGMHDRAVAAVQGVTGETAPEGVYRALVTVEPGTGRVRASYGGPDYVARPFDAVTDGRAQAGSSFKPYVLAAALQRGISLRARFDGSSPQRFGDYEVKNFGRGAGAQYGRIDLVAATADSVNTVYVPLGTTVGPRAVARTAAELGITADMSVERDLPSISLGVTAVTPLEQANAYATLAAGGVRAEPYVVERVVGEGGVVLHSAEPQVERVLSGEVAADVSFALRQVVAGGSGAAAALPSRAAAGKTGTTSGNTAAWFVGYTPRLATAVALYTDGSDQPLPSFAGVGEVTGGSLPARTWGAYTASVLEGVPPLPFREPVFGGTRLTPAPVATPAQEEVEVAVEQEPTREPARAPRPSPAPPTEEPDPAREPTLEPSMPEPTREPEPTEEPEPTRGPEPTEEPEPGEEPLVPDIVPTPSAS